MDSDKYAAQKKYHANNRQTMTIAFMKSTEQDLLDYLETVPNKAGYIKQLIREDMRNDDNSSNESELLNEVRNIVRSYYKYEHGEDYCYYATSQMETLVDLLNMRT